MITIIDVEVNAANPQMPIGPFVSFVNCDIGAQFLVAASNGLRIAVL